MSENNQDTQAVEPEANVTQQPTEVQAAEQVSETEETSVKETPTDVVVSAFGFKKTFDLKDDDGNILRTYHFQFPGVEKGTEIADKAANDGRASYWKALIAGLFVDPKVRAAGLDWFDEHKGLYEVMSAADTFLVDMLDGVRN